MRIGIGTSIVGQQVFSAKEYLSDVGGTPTAAYSVDKVVSTYTDAVVEVRRTVSAVTVEADVAFDGDTITLDSAVTITSGSSSATTLGQFVAASGYSDPDDLQSPQDAFVATWYDQAGSNDATQTTASDQPKIVSSGALVTENGKVALDFDGVDDYLEIPSSNNQFNYLHDGTTSTTFSTVRVGDGSTVSDSDHAIYTSGITTFDAGACVSYSDDNTNNDVLSVIIVRDVPGTTTCSSSVDDIFTPNTQSLVYVLFDADNATASNRARQAINGATDSGSNTSTNAPETGDASNNMQIGRAVTEAGSTLRYWIGNMQELIFYNSDKSALRTDIEDNINGRFSIYA